MKKLLRIDGSPRKESSISRQLADILQQRLEQNEPLTVLHRDTYYDAQIKLGNNESVSAYFTPEEQQTDKQKEAVKSSNFLAKEFVEADLYIFAVPMYNFTVSAGLKTYIDLISRAGISFKYGEHGPEGLLKNKKAYVIITTGGTKLGSDVDYTSGYMKTILNFLGIIEIEFIASDEIMANPEKVITAATTKVAELSF
ncbi:FMN-dependent NADH-azoreductase [Aquimarina sp. RZ0]|uniref:FMN-dependent NADH-azoreductase n=1 Tax=Aquimarina sp. RZ0 TaxID=2607730 RepID=UPI0011F0EEBF|nr:NAD(P)H-dependent oxidoreductase [Aquimarina sp. RZ0]KAA1245081.1 FMN-dependent NADH-azoreductase [Aquimarina sp. RZ0]